MYTKSDGSTTSADIEKSWVVINEDLIPLIITQSHGASRDEWLAEFKEYKEIAIKRPFGKGPGTNWTLDPSNVERLIKENSFWLANGLRHHRNVLWQLVDTDGWLSCVDVCAWMPDPRPGILDRELAGRIMWLLANHQDTSSDFKPIRIRLTDQLRQLHQVGPCQQAGP